MPLDEEAELSPPAIHALKAAELVIAESRKVAFPYLKQAGGTEGKQIFLLDPPRDEVKTEIKAALKSLKIRGGNAALFSDVGMPLLFDPGREVLHWARELDYEVKSIAGPTSWGMAAALSGFEPPFHLLGFLARDPGDRRKQLSELRTLKAHLILMDTPYRFKPLLEQSREVLGGKREAFLAWEIAKPSERLLWGSLEQLEKLTRSTGMQKGEFVLVVKKS